MPSGDSASARWEVSLERVARDPAGPSLYRPGLPKRPGVNASPSSENLCLAQDGVIVKPRGVIRILRFAYNFPGNFVGYSFFFWDIRRWAFVHLGGTGGDDGPRPPEVDPGKAPGLDRNANARGCERFAMASHG